MSLKLPSNPQQQDVFNKQLLKLEQDFEDRIAALEAKFTGTLWEPITDVVKVTSTVSSFEVGRGLSLDTDKEWLLLLRLNVATGTTHNTRLGPRGIFSDATNYTSLTVRADGVQLSSSSAIQIIQTNSPSQILADVRISKRVNDITMYRWNATHNTSNPWDGSATDLTTSDLTRIDIGSTVSNRILTGSEAQLFRKAK